MIIIASNFLKTFVLIVNTIGSVDDLIEKYKQTKVKILSLARLRFNSIFPELLEEKLSNGSTINDYVERITTGLNPRQNFKLGQGKNYYVTVKNIENGQLLLNSTCDTINDEALFLINKRAKIEKNTILFTGIGSIGRTYFVHTNPRNWNISESVFAFKARTNVPPEFLYMVLTSSAFQLYCINNASGSAQKGIRMEYLKKYPMPPINDIQMEIFKKEVVPLIQITFEYDKKTLKLQKIKDLLLSKYF